MTGQSVTLLGIVLGSGTIVIIALVGFIGRGINQRIEELSRSMMERQGIIFKEMEKKQTREICDLKTAQADKDKKGLKKDIDNVGKIARGKNAG